MRGLRWRRGGPLLDLRRTTHRCESGRACAQKARRWRSSSGRVALKVAVACGLPLYRRQLIPVPMNQLLLTRVLSVGQILRSRERAPRLVPTAPRSTPRARRSVVGGTSPPGFSATHDASTGTDSAARLVPFGRAPTFSLTTLVAPPGWREI